MQFDVVNSDNKKVGTVDVDDEVFGGKVNADLIWASVVHANAADRRGTHMTKNRALVSGSGKKPWRQKGTGRARVGRIRNPLWRHGGTVFGPQPRSYDYQLPRKVKLGALREALAAKLADGTLVVVDTLPNESRKTKDTAAMFKKLGATGKTLVIAVNHDDTFARTARNIRGVMLKPRDRVTARDVIDTDSVIVTREAMEKLEASLG